MIDTIIFDMDGVIADTDRTRFDLLKILLNNHGIKMEDDMLKSSIGEKTKIFLRKHFSDRLTEDQIHHIYEERTTEYEKHPDKYIISKPFIKECLDKLKGRFHLGIASSAEPEKIYDILNHLKLTNYFRTVNGVDKNNAPKPAPDIYLAAIKSLGSKAGKCLAVEDSPVGIASAKAAKIRCLGYCGVFTKEELLNFGADFVISSFTELTPEFISSIKDA